MNSRIESDHYRHRDSEASQPSWAPPWRRPRSLQPARRAPYRACTDRVQIKHRI